MPQSLESLGIGKHMRTSTLILTILLVIALNAAIVYCYRRTTKREMNQNMHI